MNLEWAKSIEGVDILESVDLAKFTTIKLHATGTVAVVNEGDALKELIVALNERSVEYHLIGWGANQVISRTKDTLFVKLDLPFDRGILKEPRAKYRLPASVALNVLQSHAMKFGLKGWEVFTGIPASLGGAIYMNAGTALGEIGSIVETVEILTPEGCLRTEKISPDSFSYRRNNFVKKGEVIVAAELVQRGLDPEISKIIKEYMGFRKRTQPLASYNCGCVWKNFDENHKAGLFVDKTGLNNLAFGDLRVSDRHSNFFENKGGASFEDFQALKELLEEQLLLHTGIRFELEAKVY